MVCFAQFVYNVKFENLKLFIENAQRYFPNFEWDISLNDMTISSKDIATSIIRLNAKEGDTIKFDTGRTWNQLSFVNALPKVDFSSINISEEDYNTYTNLAQEIVNDYHDSGHEVAIFRDMTFPWEHASVIMAIVNEMMPLDGFFCSVTSNILWMKKKDSYHLMTIQKNRLGRTTPDVYTNCGPQILFDMDDGFIDGDVPIEMQNAFDTWVRGGRKGPVLLG